MEKKLYSIYLSRSYLGNLVSPVFIADELTIPLAVQNNLPLDLKERLIKDIKQNIRSTIGVDFDESYEFPFEVIVGAEGVNAANIPEERYSIIARLGPFSATIGYVSPVSGYVGAY